MDTLWQDLRYAMRTLAKSPGWTAVAVVTLALGIGANTSIFSLLNAVALRPLPVERPEELVAVFSSDASGADYGTSSYPDYADWRDQNSVFSGLAAYDGIPLHLSAGGHTERIAGEIVTGNYFDVLGVRAAQGRTFLPEEDRTPGTHAVAVVSHGLWARSFGSDPALVGKDIVLNGYPFTVVGIAPQGFTGVTIEAAPQVWVPMMMQARVRPRRVSLLTFRGSRWMSVVGRLKPGVTLAQADAAMDAIARRLSEAYRETNEGYVGVALFPAQQATVWPEARGAILRFVGLLMAVVGLVLLISCANVANLLLARAATRRREIAVRLALGAGRGRLLRQLLTESVLLAMLGGALGLLLATWLGDVLLALPPPTIPLRLELSLDGRVLGFTLLLSLLTGVVFGLVPGFQAARADLVPALKEEAGYAGGRKSRMRDGLVVTQVALSLVLLIGAGLILRSLANARGMDPGFDSEKLLLASLDVRLNGYTEEQGRNFYRQLLERVESLPGVESASLAVIVPLGLSGMRSTISVDGYQPREGEDMNVDVNGIAHGYFRTMGIPLVRGRDFTERDTTGAPGVVIVNEAFARRFWPGREPLGQRIRDGGPEAPPLEVVGVVKTGKYRRLLEQQRPVYYLPFWQGYEPAMTLHVRTSGDPQSLGSAVQAQVRSLDPNLPVHSMQPMREHLGTILFPVRLAGTLLSIFGALALLLASVGLYGVMSYAVAQRTREVGIRMALGANAASVLRLMLRRGTQLIAFGVAIGLAAAAAVTHLLAYLLYGLSPTDPATFAATPLLLGAVALAACWVPARRATRIDPMEALRYE